MGMSRQLARLVVIAAVAALALLFGIAPASAHNRLIATVPAENSTISSAPDSFSVTFDQPVEDGFTELVVIGPGNTHWEGGPPRIEGNTVRAALRHLGPAGRYTIEYHIVSADGHPVEGSASFTLSKAGSGTPAPEGSIAADGSIVSGGSSANSSGASALVWWPWLVGGGVVLVVAFLAARKLAGRTGN